MAIIKCYAISWRLKPDVTPHQKWRLWGRKQNVRFSELTVESGPSHYRRCKVGGVGDEEFAGLNKALARLERFWVDQILYKL